MHREKSCLQDICNEWYSPNENPSEPNENNFTTLFIAFMHCQLFCQVDRQEIDKVIKLDGKISVSQDSERWLKISVPFLINEHPDLLICKVKGLKQ